MAEKNETKPDGEVGPEAVDETPDTEVETEPAAEVDESADTGAGAEAAPEADAEPEPTAEEVLQRERDDFEDKWLRSVAELENVRRRARRDVSDAHRFATAEVIRPLLDVLDNFERAVASLDGDADDGQPDLKSIRSGIEMILESFRGALRSRGLNPIEALGEDFDPARHEAIQQLEVEGAEPGTVTNVVQTGYTLNDIVLRPSRVVVAR